MPKFSAHAGFAAFLLITTACGQPPAMVELKGQNSYGRSTYAMNGSAPLYRYGNAAPATAIPAYTTASGNVTPSAGIQPVGVHELSALAPAAGAGAPLFATPVASAQPTTSSSSPVNPWTGKPHFTGADNAPAVAPAQPVAQLDRIIGNDGSKTHAAKTEASAFMWPVNGKKIISGFGPKGDGKTNDGINIAASEGEPVWAAADGEIVYVGNALEGYGNMVLIKHPGNKTTAYAHLSRATVDKYERVKQGDIIGYVGSTGNVKEPQLHFAIRDGKDPVDPAKFVSRSVASN